MTEPVATSIAIVLIAVVITTLKVFKAVVLAVVKKTNSSKGIGNAVNNPLKDILKTVAMETQTIHSILVNIHSTLKNLQDMHHKFDGDGIPLWYRLPTKGMIKSQDELAESQEKILDSIRSISHTQEQLGLTLDRQGATLERTAAILDSIDRRQEQYDARRTSI